MSKAKVKYLMWSGIAGIVLGLLAVWLTPAVSRELAIDRCLDAGGAYDNQAGTCLLPADPG
jgi:hypothetical protein